MLDEFLHTLEHGPPLLAYALVMVAAGIEYVLPPLPGDTIALFAVALAVRAHLNWLLLYAFMTAGALSGGLAAWGFGLWLASHEDRWPAMLRRPGAERALAAVRRGYARYGPVYLAVNRALPALRAFFFVGAGLSRMGAWAVIVWGGLSAAIWNAGLVALGYTLGNNWKALEQIYQRYTFATLTAIALVAFLWLARVLWKARADRARRSSSNPTRNAAD